MGEEEKTEITTLKTENQQLKDQIIKLQAVILQTGQRALNAEAQLLSIQRTNLQPQLLQVQAREQREAGMKKQNLTRENTTKGDN